MICILKPRNLLIMNHCNSPRRRIHFISDVASGLRQMLAYRAGFLKRCQQSRQRNVSMHSYGDRVQRAKEHDQQVCLKLATIEQIARTFRYRRLNDQNKESASKRHKMSAFFEAFVSCLQEMVYLVGVWYGVAHLSANRDFGSLFGVCLMIYHIFCTSFFAIHALP